MPDNEFTAASERLYAEVKSVVITVPVWVKASNGTPDRTYHITGSGEAQYEAARVCAEEAAQEARK